MRRLSRLADPIAVVGIAISVALAVSLDLTNAASGVESLLAGLMGATITLVLDLGARTERGFRLRGQLDAVDWLGPAVLPIVDSAAAIARQYPDSEISAEARRHFRLLAAELDGLRRGRISRPHGDYEHLIGGALACRTRLDAVTNILPDGARGPDWWSSEVGRRYWQANLAALGRGVAVTRIFVHAGLTDALRELVETQRRAGVTVGLVARSDVEPALRLNMALFDDRTAWEARMSADGEIVENLLHVCDSDVDRLRAVFRLAAMNGSTEPAALTKPEPAVVVEPAVPVERPSDRLG